MTNAVPFTPSGVIGSHYSGVGADIVMESITLIVHFAVLRAMERLRSQGETQSRDLMRPQGHWGVNLVLGQ